MPTNTASSVSTPTSTKPQRSQVQRTRSLPSRTSQLHVTMDFSDDDYEHVSDIDMCDSDDESHTLLHPHPHESAPSSPPSIRPCQRKKHDCPYEHCQKTFNRQARLDEHLRSHQNIRLFKCTARGCDKEYLRQSHLTHHTKTAHSDIRDYPCTWEGCEKSFATGTRLRRHFLAHEGREKFRCRGYGGCTETFRKHETLKKHILSVHQQIRPYTCTEVDTTSGQQCTRSFETAAKLKAHQRAMHDASRFTCTDCLEKHANLAPNGLLEHGPLLPNAFFATYSALQAHITECHPPTCQYCPTSFTTLKELSRHLELQHGWIDPSLPRNSTFTCEYEGCRRVFTKKGNLNVHVRTIHLKRKDFVCGVTPIPVPEELANDTDVEIFGCGREFTSKASLEDHVRSAHFGLETRLIERRNKRKAEMSASKESNPVRDIPKVKKTRKDKGVKKTSAFASLTGQSADHNPREVRGRLSALTTRPYDCAESRQEEKASPILPDEDGDVDDWNQLSGSMVLFGSNIYHNGQEYHYTNGQYPTGLSQPDISSERSRHCRASSQLEAAHVNYMPGFEDEPVFDNFEHEPEFMNGLHLDPLLMRS